MAKSARKSFRLANIESGHYLANTSILNIDGTDDKGQQVRVSIFTRDPSAFLRFCSAAIQQTDYSRPIRDFGWLMRSIKIAAFPNPPEIRLSFTMDGGAVQTIRVPVPDADPSYLEHVYRRFVDAFGDATD